MKLKDKVAIVTGGGKGVGKGVSLCLAKEGCKVIIIYNSNPDMANATERQINEEGLGSAEAVHCDVSDINQVKNVFNYVRDKYQRLDILVNNAALQRNKHFDLYDETDYDLVFGINLGGYINCMNEAVKFFKESKKGRIINISSIHGKRPTDFDPVYAMTKGGIKMLTREAAVEFPQYGAITVNSIDLGGVKIEFKSGNPKPFGNKMVKREKRFNRYPYGRIIDPVDAGYTVCFLASDEAEMINGAAIRLDSGAVLF